jgi:arginine/lysine/ornithine decarboxylase
MPGHKGRNLSEIYDDIFSLDLTEFTDTDNLHDAKGILKDIQNQTAHIYNTYQSRFG